LSGFTPSQLFHHKERSVYLSNSLAHQVLDKRKSFTVDETNVFQIKREPQSFFQDRLGRLA
jgi:hypothetical protein